MKWDDFKIKTTDKCPRGTVYMHPDDAAEMRPTAIGALVARLAPGKKLDAPARSVARYEGHAHGSDDAARERNRRMMDDLRARRAAGGSEG